MNAGVGCSIHHMQKRERVAGAERERVAGDRSSLGGVCLGEWPGWVCIVKRRRQCRLQR